MQRETLENGNLYLETKHAGILITTDWRGIINVNSRDYGYYQFTFTKEQLDEYWNIEAKKSVMEWKYNQFIKWIENL